MNARMNAGMNEEMKHGMSGGKLEFSRRFALDALDRDGVTVEISADPHERAALALRFGLAKINSLAATLTLERDEAGHGVNLRGNFSADVVQSCVVTLEPLANHVAGPVEAAYSTDEKAVWVARDMAPDADVAPNEDDAPELLEGDEIDIGEVVAEHLGLQLDPYPRRPGVVFSSEDGEDAADKSPFAVLRDLKTN